MEQCGHVLVSIFVDCTRDQGTEKVVHSMNGKPEDKEPLQACKVIPVEHPPEQDEACD